MVIIKLTILTIEDENIKLNKIKNKLRNFHIFFFCKNSDSCFDNTQLRETANEMEGLLGTLIRGVEQRATLNATKGLV